MLFLLNLMNRTHAVLHGNMTAIVLNVSFSGLVTVVGKTDHSVKPGGQLEARRLMVQADVEAGGSGTVNLRHSRRYVSGKDTPKGLYTGPYFSPGLVSNYTASVGETIRLNCKVYQVKIYLYIFGRNLPPKA